MLLIIIGIILTCWNCISCWRNSRDMTSTVLVTFTTVLCSIIMVLIGGFIIPSSNFDSLEKDIIVEEECTLVPYNDNSYLRIADIGYATYHYSINTVDRDTNATTTKTLKSTDYFILHYVDNPKDAKFIQTKAVAAHPLVKLFSLHYERNIDIYIPSHTISAEDTSYIKS